MIRLFYLFVGIHAACLKGQYNDTNVTNLCKDCPSGFHADKTDLTECLRCNPSTFQNESGKEDCKQCPNGTYQPNQTAVECFECVGLVSFDSNCVDTCPDGSWPSGKTCQYCSDAGKYSTGNNASCSLCEIGKYKATASPEPCKNCPDGWESTVNRDACQQCSTGQAVSQGEGACKQCLAGQHVSSNNDTCLPCSRGKYQEQPGQTTCQDCGSGKFSAHSSMSSCEECPAGYFATGGALECTQCPPGNGTSQTAQSSCQPCVGAETVQGICTDCAAGMFLSDKRCENCPRGFISNATVTECTNCPTNNYANATSNRCESCVGGLVPNMFQGPGSWKCCVSSECDDCAAGKFRGEKNCDTCPLGYVSKAGEPCRPCIIREGEYTTDHLDDCDYCAEGQSSDGTQCTDCTAGTYEFKFECINCPRGWFSGDTRNPVCERCPVGYSTLAVSSEAVGACTLNCTAAQIVDSFGNCQQCDLGKYVTGRVCEHCPLGTHKDTRADMTCRNCPSGYNTDSTGNIDCFVCPLGQQCGCPWGKFGTGGYACKDCPVGYSSSGGLECTACPLTTYQPNAGQGACLSCPPGTFGDAIATVQCKDCPSGQFQLFAGAGACEDCPRGKWGGGVQCTNCTAGKSTQQTGSTSDGQCEECLAGKMEKDHLCIDCYEGTYQNKTGSVVCDACPVDKWSAPGASQETECFGTKGLVTYTFGTIEDSKKATPYTTLCEIRANFVMVCPGCTCDADARNGFWAGPMCNECRRGFATRFCTSICPGYDGQHDSTLCNGNGRCWFGRQGNGMCYCGGHHILDSSSENVFVNVQYCPAGKICPGYGVEKVPVTTYIPLYYLINYRQYTSFVLQMSKYTPERGHMWFKRFSPSKAFENTCTVCNSKYLDSALTEIGYWNKESEYTPFPLTSQTKNGFHGENCQYECAVCLNGGKCVQSPHPYRYSYTIENTFKEQSSAIYPTTTCLCSSNVYDASHMCCPNGFQPYVYYGKRATIPYSRFTTVPYVTSVDNNIDLGYYRDIDLSLETKIAITFVEPDNGKIPVGVGTKIEQSLFSQLGPYNKHIYHGTTKEICRACPGLFGKGVRAVGEFIETEQDAENYWWNFPASAGSKKCHGQGVCDFYNQDKQIDVDFMGDINDYALLQRGRMCKSKSVGGFVSTNDDSQDITTLEECVQYAQDNSALFVGWAPEFYMGGTPADFDNTEVGSESNAKLAAAGQALTGWVKNTAGTVPIYATLKGELPEPDTDSSYEVHPRVSKRCIAFQSCIELRPLKSTAYRAFNIYTVEKGRGDERLTNATFDRFDTCFTYTKNYDHDPDKVGRRKKLGLYLTQDYEQGDDPFLGGLCPKGYFCTQNSHGTGFKEACPIGYYQPLEGKTRTDKDTHCSRETSDVIFNRTVSPRPCQIRNATKSSNDYVDKVCLRCPRDSYAPEGSYKCTQCPPGRVKKVSGEFDPMSIEIYNTPDVPRPYWYYIANEGGTEADDCALVPPAVVHVPTANFKMFESANDDQYLPVVSCPFGYSSQPGTYIIQDIWNMQNILLENEDIMVEPYINIQGDKQAYESDKPCSCIPSTTVEKYVAPEDAETCAELNFKTGEGVEQTVVGLWYGCLRFEQTLVAEFNPDLSKIHNYPTKGVKYICQKVLRDPSLMEEFVSTYCYPCPGDAMTGPGSSMCTTCTANLIKKNMKVGLQKLVTNSEARLYHCDKTLVRNFANTGTECPMIERSHTDVSVDIQYKKDIPSRYYLQTLDKTWPAQHVFGFIKDPLLPGDSVELSITDCILACESVFTKPEIYMNSYQKTQDGQKLVCVNYTVYDTIGTVLDCQKKCDEEENCNAVGYHRTTSTCKTHESCVISETGVITETGTQTVGYDYYYNSNYNMPPIAVRPVRVGYAKETEDRQYCVCNEANATGTRDAYGIAVDNDHEKPDKECYTLIQQNPDTIINTNCVEKALVNIVWYESVIIDDWARDEFPLCGLCKPGTKYMGSACEDCGTGTYTSDMIESMKDMCENCPAGFFQDNEGRTGCRECRPGQFQEKGAAPTCKDCPAGWHQNDFQSTECKHCRQGKYQQLAGQSNCLLCEPGKFESSTHNDSTVNDQPCDPCPQGYSQNERGKGRCKDCDVGRYQDSNAQLQCVECDTGRYQSEETQATCIDCPAGYAQDTAGNQYCKPCSAGSYPSALVPPDNSAITDKCASQTNCDWSTTDSVRRASKNAEYQDNTGMLTCKACPTANICTVNDPLDKCGPGHVMPAGHYTKACYKCDKSTYASASDQSACKDCTSPSIIDAAHTTCTDCKASDGKYPLPPGCGETSESVACTSCKTCLLTEKVNVAHKCEPCWWKTPIRDSTDGTKCIACEGYWTGTECATCPAVGWNKLESPGSSRSPKNCDGCGGFKLHWYKDKHKGNYGEMQGSTTLDTNGYLKYKGPWQSCCWDTNDYVKISTWIVTQKGAPGYLHISNSVSNAVDNPYEDWIDYTLKENGVTITTGMLHETKNSKVEFCLEAGKIFYLEFEYQNADGNGNFNVYTYNANTFKAKPVAVGVGLCGDNNVNTDKEVTCAGDKYSSTSYVKL